MGEEKGKEKERKRKKLYCELCTNIMALRVGWYFQHNEVFKLQENIRFLVITVECNKITICDTIQLQNYMASHQTIVIKKKKKDWLMWKSQDKLNSIHSSTYT